MCQGKRPRRPAICERGMTTAWVLAMGIAYGKAKWARTGDPADRPPFPWASSPRKRGSHREGRREIPGAAHHFVLRRARDDGRVRKSLLRRLVPGVEALLDLLGRLL